MEMSTVPQLNGNGWKPRKTETLVCPSGQSVQVHRPGPEFMLRAGRVARTFTKASKPEEGATPEYGLDVLAKMSDEELAAVMIFARELVCAMLVSPRLVQNPRPNSNEVGPDDIGDDFWFLFNYAMGGFFNLKVPVGEGEVEIADVESFRADGGVQGDSVDGESVQSNPEQTA